MATDMDVNHLFSIIDSVLDRQQPQHQQHSEGTTTSPIASADASIVPVKRKSGGQNPNGSPKDKRPMGGSRKDGLPSGLSMHPDSEQRTVAPQNASAPSSLIGGAEDVDMADDGQQALPSGGEDIREGNNVSNIELAMC